jgi:hypothetical protein
MMCLTLCRPEPPPSHGYDPGDAAILRSFEVGAPLVQSEIERLVVLGWARRSDLWFPRWGRCYLTTDGYKAAREIERAEGWA